MPYIPVDGVNYGYDQLGDGEPLILLHGFTGRRESWWPVRHQLAAHACVTLFDLPGHGETAIISDPARYTFERGIDDLAQAARNLGIDRAAWCGYSLGARVALGLTLRHPGLVSKLILESGSPGIAEPKARLERQRLDEELAARIERNGVSSFVEEWESLPLWQSQSRLTPDVRQRQRDIRQRNDASGLANSLRGMGQGAQPSLWPQLHQIRVPVLLLVGALDTKYVDIAAAMAGRLPAATVEIVAGAGHTVHLESPEEFCDLVVNFLLGSRMAETHVGMERVK